MSDIFDHEMDAWDQAIFHPDYVHEHGYDDGPRQLYNNLSYRRQGNSRHIERYDPKADYWEEESLQPEFQQLIVSQVHAQTQKSYCVSGTVTFERPYRGMRTFEFLADWVPKSQCVFTGNTVRIPQWLVRSRFRLRQKREQQLHRLTSVPHTTRVSAKAPPRNSYRVTARSHNYFTHDQFADDDIPF